MKKLMLGVFLLVVVGGGAYFLSRYWEWLFPPFPEKLFPENSLVYGYLNDFKQARSGVQQTLLWKKLDRSSSLSPERQLRRAFVMIENTTGVDVRPLLDQMTGDAAIAIFPVSGASRSGAFEAYVADETRARELIEQGVDPALRRRMTDLEKTEKRHGRITYYKYSSLRFPSRFSPCYFFTDHHLVLASGEAPALALMEVLDGKAPSLTKSDAFRDARRRADYRRGLFFYVSLEKILGLARSSLPATAGKLWPAALKITGFNALESFSYSVTVKDDGFLETGFVSVKEPAGGLLKIYLDQQPQRPEFLSSIPSGSKVVSAGTLPDFAKMWDEIEVQLKSVLSPSELQKWRQTTDSLKDVFNFDIRRDLFDTLGDQFAMAYEPSLESEADPGKLNWLLALKLKNPDQFADTVNRLVKLASTYSNFEPKEREYKGKKFVLMEGALAGKDLSPVFLFDSSWFIVATREDFLKSSVDTNRSTSISTRKDFKKVTSDFPSRVNTISYTDVQAYLQVYASMMREKSDAGQIPWMEGSDVPQDLATLSKELYGSGSFVRVQKSGIYYRSFSSVPSSFLALPALVASYPSLLEEYTSHTDK